MKIWKKALYTFLYFIGLTIINIPAIFFAMLMIGFNDSGATLTWVDCLQITVIIGGMLVLPLYLIGFFLGIFLKWFEKWFSKITYIVLTLGVFVLLFLWYCYVGI